jgi:hypothetical protein
MNFYFALQFKIINRQLRDFGLNPFLGYLLAGLCFIGFSLYLFDTTVYAPYLFVLVSLGFTARLSEMGRNGFLKMCFHEGQYRVLRIAENLLVSTPFILVLLFGEFFMGSVLLVILSILFGCKSFTSQLNFTLPTPFSRKPFEFISGFRNTFFLFPVAYLLTVVAVVVDNFNLGIFSVLLVFLSVVSFYPQPENEYYVWIFAMSPKKFLMEKVRTAWIFTSLLLLPIILVLLVFYPENGSTLLLFYTIGCLFLITILMAKYAAYPQAMNLPEGIILAMSIPLPILLFVFGPFFYLKAIKKLKLYLG